MYKKILFICFIFLLAGCTNINDNKDYVSLVKNCFTSKKVINDVSLGYKYYVPKGMEKIHDYDYNQVFLNEDVSIYLYVDVISYYYKKYFQSYNIHQNSKNNHLSVVTDCCYLILYR